MAIAVFILFSALFLAYVNGANDNFKGVATLFGSGTLNYKKALWWATITTFLGSLAALFISTKLIGVFNAGGLVAEQISANPAFLLSVGLGAALTVLIATFSGIPISTTHSLTGALLGAGLAAAGTQINFNTLGGKFFLPLLISPFIAAALTLIVYPLFKYVRLSMGVEHKMCLCAGAKPQQICIQADGTAILKATGISLTIDQLKNCQQYYQGKIFCFDSQAVLDKLHYFSSGAVSFSRGLNDTPKILALLLITSALPLSDGYLSLFGIPLLGSPKLGILLVAIAIALGGLLNAKKVALTMSQKITRMNHGQGFSANLVTAFLVIFASGWGLSVSTTHVSCGSLFAIGLVNKKANVNVIRHILLAWFLTLPLAAVLSGLCYWPAHYINIK